MLWINITQNAKSHICVAFSRRNMYSTCVYTNLLNGPTIYRKLGNANIARTYIDTRLSNFKYWDTRPYDSTNQSAVSSFDLNYFNFLDLLFSIINASPKKKDKKLKICYLFWKNLMLARALKGNWPYFVMGYHEHIWFHQCQEDINSFWKNFTRPYDSTNQSAVSSFDLNYFNFLDLLFSIINASPSLFANEHMFIIKTH
jgi:hypothetical protein